MSHETRFVNVKNPDRLADSEKNIFDALSKLPPNTTFSGAGIIRQVLERLNEIQDKIYFHPGPQSARQRLEYIATARKKGRVPEDGQFAFWRLCKPATDSTVARRWVEPGTMSQVSDRGPKGALLCITYKRTAHSTNPNGRQVPVKIVKL